MRCFFGQREWISEAATLGKDLEVLLKAKGLIFNSAGSFPRRCEFGCWEESEPSQQNEAYFGCINAPTFDLDVLPRSSAVEARWPIRVGTQSFRLS